MKDHPDTFSGCGRTPWALLRSAPAILVALAVAWWLFGDTYARHLAAPTDGYTIRFAHFGTYQDYELWRSVIADFEERYPELQVRQEYVVGLAGHYNTKMRQQILSHTLPDVALVQLGPFHELAEHFADLSELAVVVDDGNASLIAALDPTGVAAFQFRGQQRGLPISGGSLLIYANVECFERAGAFRGRPVALPTDAWTLDDFHRTAELLTCDFDGDGALDQFGFWHPRWVYYLPFLWSFGAELTDARAAQWKLVGPAAERAVAFYRDLAVDSGAPTRGRVCPRAGEVPQLFQDVGFLTGKVAMCVNGPWFLPFLARTQLADSFVVAHIPIGPAGRVTRVTWDAVVMPADLPAARRQAARRFIEYLLSPTVQDRIARTGRALPARTASTNAFVHPVGDERRRRFVEALSYSRTQPLIPRFGEVDRAINDHLARLLDPVRDLTPEAMLNALAREPVITETFSTSRAVEP